ncbi:MAG: glycosyltransferase family 2 protein [Firmicutes bacterium]|nr:glycosyltransferase family 2 protein [Bacillota bacterium]
MSDLVSIVTPVFNAASYVGETIESVLAQDYQNWEMLIVDDCSTDNSLSIIETYSRFDDRIRLIRLEQNSGVATARNVALRNARGRYIAFLDSDDTWYPNKLTRQITYMKANDVAFSFSSYEWMDEEGRLLNKTIRVPRIVDYDRLLGGNPIGCLTVVIDTDKVGSFEMPPIRHEDYATWLGITKRGVTAHGIDECLARYRRSAQSLSGNKIKSVAWTWSIYRSYLKLGFTRSVFSLIKYACSAIARYANPF